MAKGPHTHGAPAADRSHAVRTGAPAAHGTARRAPDAAPRIRRTPRTWQRPRHLVQQQDRRAGTSGGSWARSSSATPRGRSGEVPDPIAWDVRIHAAGMAPPHDQAAVHPAPPLVTIVEDADLPGLLDLALMDAGYRTLVVPHDTDATVIGQAQPALVILDLGLAHLACAVGLLQALQAVPLPHRIPVLVVAAQPGLPPALAAVCGTPYAMVQPPFPLDALLHTIAALLTSTPPSGPDRAA